MKILVLNDGQTIRMSEDQQWFLSSDVFNALGIQSFVRPRFYSRFGPEEHKPMKFFSRGRHPLVMNLNAIRKLDPELAAQVETRTKT